MKTEAWTHGRTGARRAGGTEARGHGGTEAQRILAALTVPLCLCARIPVADRQLETDDRPDAVLLARLRPAHGAAEIVVVGERDGTHADGGRALDQRFRVRGAVQEREAAVAVEFDVVSGHGGTEARRHGKSLVLQ